MITKDDLSKRDYWLAIDKSTSMGEPAVEGNPGGQTRWAAAQELVHGVARQASAYDDDGISVLFFASKVIKTYDNVTGGVDVVDKIFAEQAPGGSTNTAGALLEILDAYFNRKKSGEAKPLTIIFATDGIPDDGAAGEDRVIKAIVDATKKMDNEDEIGILFLQIGDNSHARDFLKRLDDDLVSKKGAKYDIVDTLNMQEIEGGISLETMLLNAVND